MPALYVRINWSESRIVNQQLSGDEFHPIAKVNKVLWRVANKVAQEDGGYDKTSFTLLVFDGSDNDLSEYDGRIDLGKEQNGYGPHVIQKHVKSYCECYGKDHEELKWWEAVVSV